MLGRCGGQALGAGEARRGLPSRLGGRSDPGGPDLLLFCFNAADGSLRWKKTLGSGNRLFGKQNMASPSPVTDGKRVVTTIGTGVLTAFVATEVVKKGPDYVKSIGAALFGGDSTSDSGADTIREGEGDP